MSLNANELRDDINQHRSALIQRIHRFTKSGYDRLVNKGVGTG